MRCIGDEVLAHLLEPHLAGDVAHQHQELLAGRNHEQREPGIPALHADDDAVAAAGPVEIGGELRVADEVRDRDADVDLAPQAQEVRGRAVEPADLASFRQQHGAVGQRGGQPPELAELLHDAALVELLAAIDAIDDRDHVAPDAADFRRVLVRAVPQPPLEAEQVDELPGEDAAQHDREPERHPIGDETEQHGDGDRRRQADERE